MCEPLDAYLCALAMEFWPNFIACFQAKRFVSAQVNPVVMFRFRSSAVMQLAAAPKFQEGCDEAKAVFITAL